MNFLVKLMDENKKIIAETALNAADIGRALPTAIAWMVQTYDEKYGRVIVPEYSAGATLEGILRCGYAAGTWATVESDERGTWSLQAVQEWLKS